MRGEDDAVGQAEYLLDLGRMTMLAHAIGFQVLVRAAKMGAGVAGLTGTRHAANGIDDHGAALGNPAGRPKARVLSSSGLVCLAAYHVSNTAGSLRR